MIPGFIVIVIFSSFYQINYEHNCWNERHHLENQNNRGNYPNKHNVFFSFVCKCPEILQIFFLRWINSRACDARDCFRWRVVSVKTINFWLAIFWPRTYTKFTSRQWIVFKNFDFDCRSKNGVDIKNEKKFVDSAIQLPTKSILRPVVFLETTRQRGSFFYLWHPSS